MKELPTTLLLIVTKNHIDCGFRASCSQCPIALSALEALKGWNPIDLVVGRMGVRFWVNNGRDMLHHHRYALTEEALSFIINYDAYHPVEPQTFVLPKTFALQDPIRYADLQIPH